MTVTVVGSYLSPYVRKVLVCLELKGIQYEIDPIVPFYGNDEFTRLNPVRRVPVLVDDDLVVTESAAICEYLEERNPTPSILPADVKQRARARSLQGFADGRLGDVLIWKLFNQRIIRRFVWREPVDEAVLAKAVDEEIPAILAYLEGLLPEQGFLFDGISVADIALACMFHNAALARYEIDATRWPRSAAYFARALDLPAFLKLRPFETIMLRTPIPQHRDALRAAGAPVAATTLGTDVARRSLFAI